MNSIEEILEKSQRGIQYFDKSRKLPGEQITKIFQLTGKKRMTELI
jgi:hypothetical protein